MNIRNSMAGVILGIAACGSANSQAIIWMKEVPIDSTYSGWIVTSVQVSDSDWVLDRQAIPYNDFLVYTAGNGPLSVCGSNPTSADVCLNGLRPQNLPLCSTDQTASENARALVGIGVKMEKPLVPYMWNYRCRTGLGWQQGTRMLKYTAWVNREPATVTCSIANAAMTIRGRVGERAKASKNLDIQCDSRASLRLTLSNGGLVSVGGGGEVQLLFGENSKDVLDVTGTAPLAYIEGELTKSPTTAGTYTGSSVLRLDIL